MRKFKKYSIVIAVAVLCGSSFSSPAMAATTPPLGLADTFGILSSTYTNTAPGTTINGDLGYTTGPAVAPTVNGTTHIANGTYNQAGIDQGTALANLNSQPCTFTFAPGAVDLATDATHGPIGVYTPGVYCITGAASVGTAGITLTGSGTYIFRMDGALTSVANSVVTLAGGASACDVFWTPTAATTLGANSTFAGTDIDASGITIGSTVTWVGRALAFGGTVSTSADTITAPTCAAAIPPGGGSTPPGGGSTPADGGGGTSSSSGSSSASGSSGSTLPGLPATGTNPENTSIPWNLIVSGGFVAALASLYLVRKKQNISAVKFY